MIFSEISSNRGYGIVVDGWEMFLSEAQEQMSAMRNGSIRERFIYKLLCCEMDVNTPKVVSRAVYEWCPTKTTPAGETLLLHDIQLFQNVFSLISFMSTQLIRGQGFWYGEVKRTTTTVRVVRVTCKGILDLEGAIRLILECYGGFWEKLYRFVEKTHPYEPEPDPFDQDEVLKLMKEVVRPCTDS